MLFLIKVRSVGVKGKRKKREEKKRFEYSRRRIKKCGEIDPRPTFVFEYPLKSKGRNAYVCETIRYFEERKIELEYTCMINSICEVFL